ncbi:alpha/beta hydrolase [Saccharothrix variisporea]|uniref:Acetyl esterase/lipase n=1 Tax=Saccharothrix variisporea TaxID=543527 RepID=A0A495XJY9_9PSEU|nr:alpha/beta hydrolase [Saccharothrix variisporea]RKT73495.1 acetyl esterase/lipase [Saccharothrix variisporea]
MLRKDPLIAWRPALAAAAFQVAFPVVHRLRYASPELQFATRKVARPATIRIPTRHGEVKALVYAPPDPVDRPPVHLIAHGGAFIARVPEQEDNVARFLASEVGAHVVVPNYSTAPTVRFPVAEDELFDVYRWMRSATYGWDGARISVGGASAGGKLAVNVALRAAEARIPLPVALTVEFGTVDLSRPDSSRTSMLEKPVVGRSLMSLVRRTYFAGADPEHPHVSPIRHPNLADLPPTLVLTAQHDTLREEMSDFAKILEAEAVPVTYREFEGVDHGFTHTRPVEVAREAITLIADHLRTAYTPSAQPPAEPPTPTIRRNSLGMLD